MTTEEKKLLYANGMGLSLLWVLVSIYLLGEALAERDWIGIVLLGTVCLVEGCSGIRHWKSLREVEKNA